MAAPGNQRMNRLSPVVIIVFSFAAGGTSAQINDFGMAGVLDVPSARMSSEDSLTTTYSRRDVADVYSVNYQVFDRLETGFRYTIFNARGKSPIPGQKCPPNEFLVCDGIRDRSFEVKYRLWDESDWVPSVAVGIRDLFGTGAWSSEYVVASKQFGALDLTAGIGWGRLAERSIAENPLLSLSEGMSERGDYTGTGGQFLGTGGTLASDALFRGQDIGLFGAVRYRLPQAKLDLLLAYNSDSYARERALGSLGDANGLSFGLDWEARPGLRLGLSYQDGGGVGLRLSTALNAAEIPPIKRPNGFGAGNSIAESYRFDSKVGWWERMAIDAESSGLLLRAMKLEGDHHLLLRYSNMTWQIEADAIRRVLALVNQYAPLSVRTVTMTGDALGMPSHSVVYQRPVDDSFSSQVLPARLQIGSPIDIPYPDETRRYAYPNGDVRVGMNVRTYLFDPDFPLLYQVSVRLQGDVDFGSGWQGTAVWNQSLTSQFDRIFRDGESQLPPVRTDLRRYMQEGESGIDQVTLTKRGKLSRDVYYQAYAGILEEMYSGVGVDVLWRRAGESLSFGFNVNAVKQREFNKMLGLRDYSVVTGHASAYWLTPIKNVEVAVHAGRYLAGDIGATIEVQKRFANGWSIGAFATLTDVPFSVFGEGSFDKGLIFRIPFDLYSSSNTQGAYRTLVRLVNRDGGRMLDNWPGGLWENMRHTHDDFLDQQRARMVPPR